MKINKEEILKKYTNVSLPGAYSGLSGFKKNNDVKGAIKTLRGVEAFTLHKNIKKKFKRRQTKSPGIGHIIQIDLIDVRKIKHANSHFNYILTGIDVFSRKAFAVPLKNKTARENKEAFETVFNKIPIPKIIYSDWGNEFKGVCKEYFKKLNVKHVDTKSKHKASMVERFNRTLKEKMWRYFTFNNTKRYIDVLPKLVESYNNSYHRILKTTPNKVTKANEKEIYKTLYGDEEDYEIIDFAFKKGQYVRCIEKKTIFEKGYTPGWQKQPYIIDQLIPTQPPTYLVIDLNGKKIDWKYYKEELQKVEYSEFPYDTIQVLEEKEEEVKVTKLNSEARPVRWVRKAKL